MSTNGLFMGIYDNFLPAMMGEHSEWASWQILDKTMVDFVYCIGAVVLFTKLSTTELS